MPPPFDPGNQLLAEDPLLPHHHPVDTPAGQRLMVTVRTTSATITVLLNGPDAKKWAAQLTTAAANMSGGGLIVANGVIPTRPQP